MQNTYITQAQVEVNIMNMQQLVSDEIITINSMPGGNGSRLSREVCVGRIHVTSFSVEHDDVKLDGFYKAKFELLSFIQSGFKIVKHFETYFSIFEAVKELSLKTLERHYKEQSSRYYSGIYVPQDKFVLYSRTALHVERRLAGGETLSFTFVRRKDTLAYLELAFKGNSIQNKTTLTDFEQCVSAISFVHGRVSD